MQDVKKDYYSALEVWPRASEADIKKSYFRLAKSYHPDVAGDTPQNRERFKLINEAFSILSDSQKRREYDESLRKKGGSRDANELQEQDRRKATLAYKQAKGALRTGRYDKAVLLLKTAMRYDDSNPAYHSWYGFALAMTNSSLHEARDACRRAVEMEFYNPDYHANLGYVYFRAGLKKLAVQHFSDALKWDPTNKIASKFMAKVDGRDEERGDGPIDRLFTGLKRIFVG